MKTTQHGWDGLGSQPRRITPPGEHCFFGYYDIPCLCPEGRRHLFHRVGFMDRIPGPEDEAVIGWADVEGDGVIHDLGRTTAWNFQQGAFLRWWPGKKPVVCFNSRSKGRFETGLYDLDGKQLQCLPHASAEVDPAGRHAFGINFCRRFYFRPGYGYPGLADPHADQAQPEDDGIWMMCAESGRSELAWSLAEIGSLFPPPGGEARKLLIDHINCNPSGSRLLCFVRAFPTALYPGWDTLVLVFDVFRRTVEMIRDYGVSSHYHWYDDDRFVMVIKTDTGLITPALYDLRKPRQWGHPLDSSFFKDDGHCSYSPDRQLLLYDSYPIQGRRELYVYDMESRKGVTLGSVLSRDYSKDPVGLETRCDLHPRWMPDGKSFTFDSVHEGFRGVYHYYLPESL